MERLRTLARNGSPVWLDVLVAVVACTVAELEMALGSHIGGPAWVNALGAAAVTLPVAFRRRAPLAVAIAVMAAIAAQEALGGDLTQNSVAPLIVVPYAVYALAAYSDRRRALVGLGALVVLIWVDVLMSKYQGAGDYLFTALLIGGPWLVGRIVNARVELADALRDKAERLEREQAKQADLAVAEERARIARELHDVVAHNVSVMVVQAAAARRMIDQDPDKARTALESVEETGRDALREMRRMLGMLRKGDEDLALAPQPSISEIDWLLERAREAGLDVDLTIEGEKKRLQSSVDLSAFRIVQEALTNTLKHAGPARAHVTVRYSDSDVELEVSDDGRSVPGQKVNGAPAGQGLVGMRERVAMLGGRMEAGYRKDGGFGVHATLPLEHEGS
jgi:signal transduction histidine kinase